MKRILLLALLFPMVSFSQTVRTTTQAGDFLNPLIWNPMGIPASGDSLYINHAVNLNTNIYYTAGRITITPNGSLIEDATDRSFWADGTGSVVNAGIFTTHLLALSPGASFTNNGQFVGIDSLWNQGNVTNAFGGNAELYDFWNDQTGVFINSGVLSNADSVLNQGSFTNNTSATISAFLNDQMAILTNNGTFEVQNDMNNQGPILNNAGIIIGNDFSNCNIQSMDAVFTNNGRVCIANDFMNCIDDTLTGTGSFYIGGSSSNFGVFDGTIQFYTPSGTVGVPGNIQPGVTVAVGTCNLGIEEEKEESFTAYPNPTQDNIYVTKDNVKYQLFDITGKVVGSGTSAGNTIKMDHLKKGVYLLKVQGEDTQRIIKQ